MRPDKEDSSTFSPEAAVDDGVELLPGRGRDSPLGNPPTEPTELSIFTVIFLKQDDLRCS
jgi:hypothetical protein